MKLQYLFLPLVLWSSALFIFFTFPPSSAWLIALFIMITSGAVYFSVRLKFSHKTAFTVMITAVLFMSVSAFLGFSYINTVLILAIGALIAQLL